MVDGVDGACDVPEELPAPRTAGGSETCCDDVFFFVGGDSWPESESAESVHSVFNRSHFKLHSFDYFLQIF